MLNSLSHTIHSYHGEAQYLIIVLQDFDVLPALHSQTFRIKC